MSTQRLDLRASSLYFIALGGCDPVAVTIGISTSPISLALTKTRRIRREAVLWFAAIGPRSRASAALGSFRSRMGAWPAQDGWYLIPVKDGRAFRRCFGNVVENYSQQDAKKSIHSIDLQDYSRSKARPDFTFSHRVNDPKLNPDCVVQV